MIRGLASAWLFLLSSAVLAQDQPEFKYQGWLQNEFSFSSNNTRSVLNRDNAILRLKQHSNLTTVAIRPAVAWGLKATGRGQFRLRYSTPTDDVLKGSLDELFTSASISENIQLDLGREIIKWGPGYAWNPTGVINAPKDPRDPNDRLRKRSGVDIARLDFFWGAYTLSTTLLPDFEERGDLGLPYWRSTTGVFRATGLIRGYELALVARVQPKQPDILGWSGTKVFGPALELHLEASVTKGTNNIYLQKLTEEHTVGDSIIPRLYQFTQSQLTGQTWYPQILCGGQYTFRGNVNLTIEYYHNHSGWNRAQWDLFVDYLHYADQHAADSLYDLLPAYPFNVARGYLLWGNLIFDPLAARRDYLFTRLYLPWSSEGFDFEQITLVNINDKSFVAIPYFTKTITNASSAYLNINIFGGKRASVFGLVQKKFSFNGGFILNF